MRCADDAIAPPFDKPTLIVTSADIEGPEFAKRCADELHYQPYRFLRRLSTYDLEGLPQIESL